MTQKCRNCPLELATYAEYFTEDCPTGGGHKLNMLEVIALIRGRVDICEMPECDDKIEIGNWERVRVDHESRLVCGQCRDKLLELTTRGSYGG